MKGEGSKEIETVYTARSKSLKRSLVGLLKYRDLVFLFAKRNLTVKYKQTILGPLWLIILPFIEAIVSAFVFGGIAKIPSGTAPYFLFYYVGATFWYLVSACVTGTGNTFAGNARMFQKVYFPRLVTPVSNVLSNLFSFAVRLVIMLALVVIFALCGASVAPVWEMIWLLPLLFLFGTLMALGVGLIFSSLTAKYRDLTGLIPVFMDLLKYVTPVVYTTATLEGGVKTVCLLNPIAPMIEAFKCVILGHGCGELSFSYLGYSALFTLVVLFIGLLLFNRTEKNFVDLL